MRARPESWEPRRFSYVLAFAAKINRMGIPQVPLQTSMIVRKPGGKATGTVRTTNGAGSWPITLWNRSMGGVDFCCVAFLNAPRLEIFKDYINSDTLAKF